jgi:hypothetical protein
VPSTDNAPGASLRPISCDLWQHQYDIWCCMQWQIFGKCYLSSANINSGLSFHEINIDPFVPRQAVFARSTRGNEQEIKKWRSQMSAASFYRALRPGCGLWIVGGRLRGDFSFSTYRLLTRVRKFPAGPPYRHQSRLSGTTPLRFIRSAKWGCAVPFGGPLFVVGIPDCLSQSHSVVKKSEAGYQR